MRRLVLILIAAASCVWAHPAENAITNPNFAEPGADATMPAGWELPAGGGWVRVAEGGPDGGPWLSWQGGEFGAATQRTDFVTPGATYRIEALVRATRDVRPVIRVLDPAEEAELVVMTARDEAGWHRIAANFRTRSANLEVQILPGLDARRASAAPDAPVGVAEVVLTQVEAGEEITIPDLGENIALGRPYTMEPRPGYSYCTDPGDATQLTDGEYSEGYFWTRPTTVGWTGSALRYITIDLGEDRPIRGVSFSTAAGVAEVRWPQSILMFVSLDGQTWHEVGDLMQLYREHSTLPEYGEYAVRRIWTDDLRTHGRYLQLAIEPNGSYLFCDEIEVYRGEDAWLAESLPGEPLANVQIALERRRVTRLIAEQFRRDLDAVRADIAQLPPGGRRAEFELRATGLAEQIDEMVAPPMEGFVAILPMTPLEAEIFALQAEVWRAQGKAEMRLWDRHRWEPLAPSAEPEDDAGAAVEVAMMSNEYRADVFNITNASDRDQRLRLRITGLPGGDNPEYITVHGVEHVGTRWFTSVAAALPEAERVGTDWQIDVPRGMTRQVWVAVNRPDLDAGTYTGRIELTSAAGFRAQVPISLRIYPLRFPDETTLMVGGWAYTDAERIYGVTPENRDAIIRHLQEHFVNAPWATGASIMSGRFDDEGNIIEPPDTARFDAWVERWPDAKMYLVFAAVGGSFDGARMDTQIFANKVGAWAQFWSAHMEELGKRPDQLGLLLVDEPHSREQYETILAWARAIEAAAPGIVTWEDPTPSEPDPLLTEMLAAVDDICPNRRQFMSRGPWYTELIEQMRADGKRIWLYSCDGPARSFDPFSYYLMQEWHAFGLGAVGSNFWCFTDTGGVSCWNEYPAQGAGPYCPSYIDDTSVTTAKYMEAIREGIEDYEYLTMLRARVSALQARGVADVRVDEAAHLLDTAVERLMAMDLEPNYTWDQPKDRTVQDRVRAEVLEALVGLADL